MNKQLFTITIYLLISLNFGTYAIAFSSNKISKILTPELSVTPDVYIFEDTYIGEITSANFN